ncbi:hypothetical protein ASPTUDRAFT_241628 [Aspergillus tubingensis CBS 134.48]|uniref:Uncharacterized protein n=1 Tax=Aspergillus tubingensis (strain CBS 134.48) TaxID=767770 RepID=A0A1L9NMD0_ASPTC|nr:hypothetical protein ASPTUDRAFT_241628 [Aspergillus tubingensis CBS 134.48]
MRLYCVIARELSPSRSWIYCSFSLFVSSMGLGSRASGFNPPALALSLSLSLICQGNISTKCVGLRYRNDPPTSFSSLPSSSPRIPGTSHLILEFRLVFVRVHDQCPEPLTFPLRPVSDIYHSITSGLSWLVFRW